MNAQTAKITPGKCEARFIWACMCGHQGGHWNVFMENGEQIPKLSEADAKFIAEAFNVCHETGLTPSRLADQRAELLEAANEFAEFHKRLCPEESSNARQALNRFCAILNRYKCAQT